MNIFKRGLLAFSIATFFSTSALADVTFVQASTPASGVGSTSATAFSSNNTPGNTVCDFIFVASLNSAVINSVTDGNSSVYTPVVGSAPLSIWCTPSVGGSAAPLTLTAHLSTAAYVASSAAEYAGAGTTIATLIGSQGTGTAGPCGPVYRTYTVTPCTTSMTTSSISANPGSAILIVGLAPKGTISINFSWNSRINDAADGIAVADQLTAGGGVFSGAMSDSGLPDSWLLYIVELKKL